MHAEHLRCPRRVPDLMRFCRYAALVALFSAGVLAYGADESIDALKKQIQELDQKVRQLERKLELQNEGTQTSKAPQPKLSAGADGFSFSSADTNFVLKLRGYVQADARFYAGDHIPANDTFLMRRVRPIFEGRLWKYYEFRIMLDVGTGTTSS